MTECLMDCLEAIMTSVALGVSIAAVISFCFVPVFLFLYLIKKSEDWKL